MDALQAAQFNFSVLWKTFVFIIFIFNFFENLIELLDLWFMILKKSNEVVVIYRY